MIKSISLFEIQAIQALVPSRYCKYVEFGCKFKEAEAVVAEHEESCMLRSVQCPRWDCQTKVQICDLLGHLSRSHNAVTLSTPNGQISDAPYYRVVFQVVPNKSYTALWPRNRALKWNSQLFMSTKCSVQPDRPSCTESEKVMKAFISTPRSR